ncbi:nucleotide disphospho-sugar-binding domain-containing protein [Sediminivirga luteola]|nr:nucleotide disphospho-sugar-binding domain-containing protein [Sediminivirga luteola]
METSMAGESRTFLFLPESAYGPTNNCIGIGNELLKRGHRLVFAAERSWDGKLAALGFEEALVDLAPPAEPADGQEEEQDAGQFWKDYIKEISPEFAKPTIDQLETVSKPIMQELIDGAIHAEPQLKEIIAQLRPDVVVEDNVVAFPALVTAPAPFVRIVSCNPLEIRGQGIAPVLSGLPEDDAQAHAEFRARYDQTHRPMWADFNRWVQEQGAPALPELEFMHPGDVNLYIYPEELDYLGRRPLPGLNEPGSVWQRVESSVRETEADAQLPPGFADGSLPLIYFSLGSLGSADVGLMRRVVSALADQPYRVIVSKGPLHEEIELPENMWGEEFLPQTTILPLVDLVITHGGNNTTTEAFHFGKPMVLLPLFWDQYDNAQRVHEKGFGVRLDTYGFTPEQLRAAVDGLLADTALRERMAGIGERIRAGRGVTRAADVIEAAAGSAAGRAA